MTNAREEFGLTDTPVIHGVVEHETEAVAADDYSRQIDEKLKAEKQERAKPKAVKNKVPAYKIAVSGSVRKGETMEAYNVSVVIPQCDDDDMQYHIQRFVVAELIKDGKLYDGVINRNIDEIEETELELTFAGKDVFALSKDEIQVACDYYGLRGCSYNNPSVRNMQREFYKKYLLKTDESLQDQFAQKEFITKVDSIVDYKKLPKVTLAI
jgi:hypothetical protein